MLLSSVRWPKSKGQANAVTVVLVPDSKVSEPNQANASFDWWSIMLLSPVGAEIV